MMYRGVLCAVCVSSAILVISDSRAAAMSQICAPRLDGRACSKTICPATGELCQPTIVACTQAGHCEIVECDCLTQRECHVRLIQAGGVARPVCTGQCLPGWQCELNRKTAEDGTVYVWCECDEIPCEPAAGGLQCRKSRCDTTTERCQPSVIECDADGECRVAECDCQPRSCRPRVPPGGTLTPGFQFCAGACPQGTRCEEVRSPIDGGGFQIKCSCESPECEPTDDALRCRNAQCPDASEECRPEVVICDPNDEECRVARCDCQRRNSCHPQINTDPALPRVTCVGECPEGTICEMRREVGADGTVAIRCECVPQECEPDDSGLRCTDVDCPALSQQCRPTRVFCNANGQCRVIECDCTNANLCHVELASSGPVCVGACPQGTDCFRQVTEVAGGIVVECRCVPVETCGPTDDATACVDVQCPTAAQKCTPTLIACDPAGHCLVERCECIEEGRCHPEINPAGTQPPVSCVGECPPGQTCELFREQTAGGFILFGCRCVPDVECGPDDSGLGCQDVTCPNPGERCVPREVVCIPGAICRVVSCDCQDQERCHVEVTATDGPTCVGSCPDGTECRQTTGTRPDGTTTIRCDCVGTQPCRPEPNSNTGCSNTACPLPNERCIPTKIVCGANGGCRVVACDCRDPEGCRVAQPSPTVPPICVGQCPPGQTCEREVAAITAADCALPAEPGPCDAAIPRWFYNVETNRCEMFVYGGCGGNANNFLTAEDCMATCPDGGTATQCRCVDAPFCGPDDSGLGCQNVICPNAGELCVPREVRCIQGGGCRVVSCDCQDPDRCHVEVTASGGVACVGACPDGTECRQTTGVAPDGSITIRCDCGGHSACEPEANSTTGCSDTPCPLPEQRCIPTKIVCRASGGCLVVDCDCQDPGRCHVAQPTPTVPPLCLGDCPPGTTCERELAVIAPNSCTLPAEPGDCEAAIPRWFYNVESNQCELFIYGGCGGNANNFVTREDCQASCPHGGMAIRCHCVDQPECRPNDSGLGCEDVACPDTTRQCRPSRVFCTANNVCRVVDCDCTSACHVELTAAAGPVCVGACPPGADCVRHVTEVDGGRLIECRCEPVLACGPDDTGLRCRDVVCPIATQRCIPTKLICGPNGCRVDDCECRDPNTCHIETDSTNVPICVGACPPGAVCNRLITTDPAGITTFECRCQPSNECEPDPNSPTGCRQVLCPTPNERCLPTRAICTPAGCRPVDCECQPFDGCRVRISPNGAFCDGACPPGTVCERRETETDEGTLVECFCAPVTVCEPDDSGMGCQDINCPDATQKCVPQAIACDANLENCRVVTCGCQGSERCHPEFDVNDTGVPVLCVGECPAGQTCEIQREQDATGRVVFRCQCVPQDPCQPDPTSPTGCRQLACPTPNERCLPTRVLCGRNGCRVLECECQPFESCRVQISPAGAFCEGPCPAGTTCQRHETQTNEGIIVECRCDGVEPVCGPDSTGTGCRPVTCVNPDEKCVPTRVFCDATGSVCRVVECECGISDFCHPEVFPSKGVPVMCVGQCPSDPAELVCAEIRTLTGTGVLVTCQCLPPSDR